MNSDPKERSSLSVIKQAYLKIEELQAMLDTVERAKREPIAIVGMACRFPGGNHAPESFWQFLREGRDAIREIPADRWDVDAFYHPDPGTPGKMYTRNGGFLDQVDLFDPQFFGIAPREAIGMDPQQRLLLEVAWEALERSGIAPDRLSGTRSGVFVGLCTNDYADLQLRSLDVKKLDSYHASGIAHSIASGRISYVLGLQGPSVTLDTACSSSLVAVHLACQSLRERECNMALAAGVNVILSPDMFIALSKASMLAKDGRCKTFDASADGYARGEGCGVVVLKRLSDALADGDTILALLRGSAINQDGPSSGLTAPNGPSQISVIRDALASGGVQAQEISYVETHGTGTSLGDPIEVQALGEAYGESRPSGQPLLIGSVKSNIGHLEGSAGLAGLIKLVLAMQHGELPPSLHLEKPNPFIPWQDLSVKVITQLTKWHPGRKRLAGLSSFGFSGTNAHVIVEEAPPLAAVQDVFKRPKHLLALSAPNDEGLAALAKSFSDHLEFHQEESIQDVCHSANAGRAQWGCRLAVLGDTQAQIRTRLGEFLSAGSAPAGVSKGRSDAGERRKPAFLFTGQGSQYVGMGRELFETQPTFRRALEQCAQLLERELHSPLLSVLYPEEGQDSPLDETAFTQPALFSLEYALAQLWSTWGITPAIAMGHSVGEYVAACLAGVFSLEDGIKLIAARGRLMQQKCERGAMAAIAVGEARVSEKLLEYGDRVVIGALNGPTNTVISGQSEAVRELVSRFTTDGIKARQLAVSHAFHSPLMEPMLEEFRAVASTIHFHPARIPLVSNLTGKVTSAEEISNPDYWVRHIRGAVNFSASMETLKEKGHHVYLELGPSPALLGMGKLCLPESFGVWLPSLSKGRSDWQTMLESLSGLYVRGGDVDWTGFDRDYHRRRVVLPTYPFQRKRYWVELPESSRTVAKNGASTSPRKALEHPLLSQRLQSPLLNNSAVLEAYLSPSTFAWTRDHEVFTRIVFPATGYLEMILAAAKEALGPRKFSIQAMDIREVLILDEDETRKVQILVTKGDETGEATFEVVSLSFDTPDADPKWKTHAAGKIRTEEALTGSVSSEICNLGVARERCNHEISVEDYHQKFAALGMKLGPCFKGLEKIWIGEDQVLGKIRLVPEIAHEAQLYRFHPALLDPCLQPFAAAVMSDEELTSGGAIYMPLALESFTIYREPGDELWSHITIRQAGRMAKAANNVQIDVTVFDYAGELVAAARGLSLRRVNRESLLRRGEESLEGYIYEMTWKDADKTNEGTSRISGPDAVREDLRNYISRHQDNAGLLEFAALFPQLEVLSTQYVFRALEQLGWKMRPGERLTYASKAAELNVPEKYLRLFGRMLGMLREDGLLAEDDDTWELRKIPVTQDPDILARGLLKQYPECSAELNMTARCGARLAEVIRGECDPLQLLFPDGSVEDIEKLYRDSPFSRFYHGLIGDAIQALVARWPSDKPVRILEIGAGTGSTTASVLPRLPANRVEYTFTDVTPLFASRAREKFGSFSFVNYQLLNIESDPIGQGFIPHSYDVVIAANVLHATADLRRTINNVQKLLAPGGTLVLLEGTQPLRFGDLIVGLTEGWWKFEDRDMRPSHALMSKVQWQALLVEAGFTEVVVSPDAATGNVLANQNLILSQRGEHSDIESNAGRRWMIFADREGVGERLAPLLAPKTENCYEILPGMCFESLGGSAFRVNPENPEDFLRLFREVADPQSSRLAGVVFLWPLDTATQTDRTPEELTATVQAQCESLLHLVKALVAEGSSKADSLWIVTRGAQFVGSLTEHATLEQTSVSAIAGTIGLEYPELRSVRIDLDPNDRANEAQLLYRALQSHDDETLIAFRDGSRKLARLSRMTAANDSKKTPALVTPSQGYRLRTSAPGVLDRLEWEPFERRSPAPGEVEVEVLVTGLNFRDVLIALGRYPGNSDVFGYECAGKVVALGEGVHDLQLGQRVIVMGPGGFASHLTLPCDHVMPVPDSVNDLEAAIIPSAFLTAHYALYRLGKITAKDRVLIHAAAGGVGLAAVQLAQRAGAEIFATAGSPEKRAYLKSLGVAHVMDSRSLDFAAEIMQATQGKGVDVILNSLAGEFIDKSMSVMAANGRFLEIGMTGIWDEARVSGLNKNIGYYPINLAATFQENPRLVGELLRDLIQEFATGRLHPLPIKVFSMNEVAKAFRYMAQARHVGKIVVTHDARRRPSEHIPGKPFRLDPNGSYLITGGLSGLGLLVARWMSEQGARHLVLTARSKPSDDALAVIRDLQQQGVQVMVTIGDVADRRHLEQVFSSFGNSVPDLRGLVHSAGVVDDGSLLHQSGERFQKVLRPKVTGSWYLHELTKELDLDFFVLFSSAVSLLGSAGQANHVAACAFEDGLAHYRRALGLTALSINWGPWAETGAATRGIVGQRLSGKGVRLIEPDHGLRILQFLLEKNRTQAGVLSVDWQQYSQSLPRGYKSALLSELRLKMKTELPDPDRKAKPEPQRVAFLSQLNQSPVAQKRKMLTEFIRDHAVKVLGLDASQPIDAKQPLSEIGLDSLMAVELRSVLSTELCPSRGLPATLVFDYPTIAALTDYLIKDVLHWEDPVETTSESTQKEEDFADLLDRIERLSDEETDQMYIREKSHGA